MPAVKKQFWATFGDNQFPETLGMLLEGWKEDFWLKIPFSTFSSFISDNDEPESNKE
jgi:hypothetical protein